MQVAAGQGLPVPGHLAEIDLKIQRQQGRQSREREQPANGHADHDDAGLRQSFHQGQRHATVSRIYLIGPENNRRRIRNRRLRIITHPAQTDPALRLSVLLLVASHSSRAMVRARVSALRA